MSNSKYEERKKEYEENEKEYEAHKKEYEVLQNDEFFIKSAGIPQALDYFKQIKHERSSNTGKFPNGRLLIYNEPPSRLFLRLLKETHPKKYKEMSEAGFVEKI